MGSGETRFGEKTKTAYPPRGDLQQYRLERATAFTCTRCQEPKVAKLIATSTKNPDVSLCNGCYGRLISVDGAPQPDADAELTDQRSPEAPQAPADDEDELLPVGDDDELGMQYGLSVSDRGVEWTFHLRQENLSWEWCPMPPFMAGQVRAQALELSVWRIGNTTRPVGDRQTVRPDVRDGHSRLLGTVWPADVLPGTRVVARWDRWKNVRFSLTALVPPEVVEGHLVRYAYEPRIMTRDLALIDLPDHDVRGVLLRTVRRLGLLDQRGRAMLPEPALLRNAAVHSEVPLPPEPKLRAAVKRLIADCDLTVERGSRGTGGYLRYPAQRGEREVELLCYTPQRRRAEQDDLRKAETAAEHSVRAHDVSGHLMYLGRLGKEASEEARAAYREDHSRAGLVGPHEIPPGYTYVRPHRRGR